MERVEFESRIMKEVSILSNVTLRSLAADCPIFNVITIVFGHYPSSSQSISQKEW